MISNQRSNPHGPEFKSWGSKVSSAFGPSHNVLVTTKHSYAIAYKYIWECVVCGYEFKRHSKSVDPKRHSCGRCKGKLVQTKPVPRKGTGVVGEKSEYQVFVKENYARVKRGLDEAGVESGLGKVMEVLGREYRERKEREKKEGKKGVGEMELALEKLSLGE